VAVDYAEALKLLKAHWNFLSPAQFKATYQLRIVKELR